MKKATGISYAERAKQYSKDVGRQLHADNGELSLLNALQCRQITREKVRWTDESRQIFTLRSAGAYRRVGRQGSQQI